MTHPIVDHKKDDEVLGKKFSKLGEKDQQVLIFLYEWDIIYQRCANIAVWC